MPKSKSSRPQRPGPAKRMGRPTRPDGQSTCIVVRFSDDELARLRGLMARIGLATQSDAIRAGLDALARSKKPGRAPKPKTYRKSVEPPRPNQVGLRVDPDEATRIDVLGARFGLLGRSAIARAGIAALARSTGSDEKPENYSDSV